MHVLNNSGNSADLTFTDSKGFIALAHPSPIHIGEHHGVYILAERDHAKDTGGWGS